MFTPSGLAGKARASERRSTSLGLGANRLEAFIPLQAQIPLGHNVVSVGYGRLEAGGWYLVRRSNGHYDLSQIAANSGRALVATRSIRSSPFRQEGDAVYFAGYDANKVPAHDTAWIMRSTIAGAIGTTWPR